MSVSSRSRNQCRSTRSDPGRGLRYTSQELLETSLVTVPANPAALQLARSLNISDETIRLAFGELAVTTPGGTRRGEHADPYQRTAPRAPSRSTTMELPIARQVEEAQARLNTTRDALAEHIADPHADPVERDAMSADVVAAEQNLASLERAEKALAPRGPQQQVAATTVAAPAVIRRPLGMPKAEVEPIDYWARAGAAALLSYTTGRSREDIVKSRHADDEASLIITRAAQPTGLTTYTGWAAELVQTATAGLLLQRSPSRILTGLSAAGTTLNFDSSGGIIKIPSTTATPSIAGSFVGEAQPIPVRRMGFTSIELRPHKMGVITRYSRELADLSNPSIESVVRAEIIRTTNIVADTLLIDATVGSATRPAGILNGVSALTATAGGGYGAILGDIKKLTAPFYTANAGTNLVMLMNPAQRLDLTLTPGPGNMGIGWTAELMSTFTVIEIDGGCRRHGDRGRGRGLRRRRSARRCSMSASRRRCTSRTPRRRTSTPARRPRPSRACSRPTNWRCA